MKQIFITFAISVAGLTAMSCGGNKSSNGHVEDAKSPDSASIVTIEDTTSSEKDMEAERLEQEAAEKKRLEQEAAEQAERESKIWTGASSIDELKRKIEGTTWTSEPNNRYGGLIYKFVFSNGVLRSYSTLASDGCWPDSYLSFTYEVTQKRDINGQSFAAIRFGDNSDLNHVEQTIAFIGDNYQRVVWIMGEKVVGDLNYGDYKW